MQGRKTCTRHHALACLLTRCRQEKQVRLEATPAERIEQLEFTRAKLVKRRTELEKKISDLSEKKQINADTHRKGAA